MAMRVDSAILAVVVAFLIPLRLLSFVVRLNTSGSAGDLRRSCTAFAIAAALLAVIFGLPRDHVGQTGHCVASVTNTGEDGMGLEVRLEIEQLKLQLNRLESLWETNSKASDGKGHGSDEGDEVVKAMELDIQALIKEQENIKAMLVKMHTEWENNSKASGDKGHVSEEDVGVVKAIGLDIQALIKEQENIKELLRNSESTIKSVTNEVLILAAESRKMNSDIYNIWSLANDTEKTVEALHSDVKKVQVLTDESRKLGSSIRQVWSLAKDTGKKVEALYADIEKVQIVSDMSRKMESNMHKMWSYAKKTEKRVEDLYSDVKKGFKKNGPKIPFWTN
ncbi:uncharacterized protein LOC124702204 isoform X2 [Lolium rigidum]|uniref:uncharacterized protein LOC124702204 isoform X2 n=1 Tax=Lolium rigidum TaxID=89674 RepID=UPI001F5DA945|nr:uncharacterized protein LOC124702204 isoform X2 [Lolium rigidum]